MNKPSPSLYERVAQQNVSRFAGTYAGSVNAAVLVVSSCEPSDAAKAALTASFRTLGYSSPSIGWAMCANGSKPLGGNNQADAAAGPDAPEPALSETDPRAAEQTKPAGTASQPELTTGPAQPKGGDLFTLIEAIDPLCVVSLDKQAATALSHDFNAPLPLEARTLLMGHACLCFQDFDSLLSSDKGKHKAWGLLKQLPKLPQ